MPCPIQCCLCNNGEASITLTGLLGNYQGRGAYYAGFNRETAMKNGISANNYILIYTLVSLLCISCSPCLAGKVDWRSLVFEGNGLFASVRSEIDIMPGNATLTGHFMKYQVPMSNFLPDEPVRKNLLILHASTAIRGMFIPDIEYERAIWFHPKTLRAVGRLRWNMNKPETVKLYKWGTDAVTRWKLKYNGVNRSMNTVSTATYSFGSHGGTCATISEPVLLLYLVSLTGERVKAQYDICVFGKKKLHHLSIVRKPIMKNDLEDSIYDKQCVIENRKTGNAVASCPEPDTVYRIIELTDSRDEKNHGEKFSLLGLAGEITIMVARSKGLPVQISGDNEYAGRLVLRLKRAVMD